MSEKYGNYDEYNVDGPSIEASQGQNDVALVPLSGLAISDWTGGTDYTDQIATLPQRLDWDKKEGFWYCEEFKSRKLKAEFLQATTIWAIWSETVGRPESIVVGVRPDLDHEMGIRIVFSIDDFLYYWDAFGLAFKTAQSVVRRAKRLNGHIMFVGNKQVSTRFGQFHIPVMEQLDEVE